MNKQGGKDLKKIHREVERLKKRLEEWAIHSFKGGVEFKQRDQALKVLKREIDLLEKEVRSL